MYIQLCIHIFIFIYSLYSLIHICMIHIYYTYVYIYIDRQINRQINRQIDRQIDRQMKRQIGRQIQIDGQMDGQIDRFIQLNLGSNRTSDEHSNTKKLSLNEIKFHASHTVQCPYQKNIVIKTYPIHTVSILNF